MDTSSELAWTVEQDLAEGKKSVSDTSAFQIYVYTMIQL